MRLAGPPCGLNGVSAERSPSRAHPVGVFGVVGAVGAVALVAWIGPQLAARVRTGRLIGFGLWQAEGAAILTVVGRRPASVYPHQLRAALPRRQSVGR